MPEANQPRLLISVPTIDSVKTETLQSLMAASSSLPFPAKLHLHQSAYVHDARNKSAQMALDQGFTHLMFIDSDMQFPPNSIEQLLDLDKDIVGGLYFRRQPPHMPTLNIEKENKLVAPFLEDYNLTKPFPIFSVATGFMLIKVGVLKKIPPQWFGFGKYHGVEMGEDVYFCWKAHQHGFEVWCDPTISLGHIGTYVFTKADYDAYADLRKEQIAKKETESGEFDGQL